MPKASSSKSASRRRLIGFARYPDMEVQENMYRIYNEYTIDRLKGRGGRSVPVAVFSNWWNPAAADRAMQQIIDLGFKTFMVPCTAGQGTRWQGTVLCRSAFRPFLGARQRSRSAGMLSRR